MTRMKVVPQMAVRVLNTNKVRVKVRHCQEEMELYRRSDGRQNEIAVDDVPE